MLTVAILGLSKCALNFQKLQYHKAILGISLPDILRASLSEQVGKRAGNGSFFLFLLDSAVLVLPLAGFMRFQPKKYHDLYVFQISI